MSAALYHYDAGWRLVTLPPEASEITRVDAEAGHPDHWTAHTATQQTFVTTDAGQSWQERTNHDRGDRLNHGSGDAHPDRAE